MHFFIEILIMLRILWKSYRAVEQEKSVFFFHFLGLFLFFDNFKVLWIARKCARINCKQMKKKYRFLLFESILVDFTKHLQVLKISMKKTNQILLLRIVYESINLQLDLQRSEFILIIVWMSYSIKPWSESQLCTY